MNGKFQGQYVKDIVLALTASAVSGQHCVLIGAPGRGKTAISCILAKKIFGDESIFFRFDPSTPPETLKGYPDVQKFITGGGVEINPHGTAYDPDAKVFIFDEWWRAMDTLFDIGIDVLARQYDLLDKELTKTDAPVVWATANFVPQNERTDAVRDRFGLTVWLEPEQLDMRAVAAAQLAALSGGMVIDNDLPTWDDILAVRQSVPGNKAIAAVCDVIAILSDEAEKYSQNDGFNFDLNPRRVKQWVSILYLMSVFRTGDPDFAVCHPDAIAALRWAWPSKNEKEAQAWAEVCSALADPMQAAIDNLFTSAHEEMRKVTGSQTEKATRLGEILNNGQRSLVELARSRGLTDQNGEPTDPRVKKAITDLTIAMSQILLG